MKTLTLIQPWASLIALGEKKIETRSWRTNYHGELFIHAGKSIYKEAWLYNKQSSYWSNNCKSRFS
ncbi:ASCH domain-containing protein [Clostridium sp. WILCCON 0269]|uniref:ASCH domain-containing protein n=1 Tax=Candidatus Clostridium eludens TaxID=3381663 RepID=A0ABW8SLP3_9CLOT